MLGCCYGLKVYVPPKVVSGDQVMRKEPSWLVRVRDQCHYKRPTELHVRSEGSTVYNPKEAFIRTQPCWHPDIGLPASRIMKNKFLLFTIHWVCGILFYYSSLNRLRHFPGGDLSNHMFEPKSFIFSWVGQGVGFYFLLQEWLD